MGDKPLHLEACQRRVDRADGHFASGPGGDLLTDGDAVSFRPEPVERQHDVDLEFAEKIPFGHEFILQTRT
jgi:hypothetical protein